MERLSNGVFRLSGSVYGGVLVEGGHALLIDAPELPVGSDVWDQLTEQGVHTVDAVLLTQHRRQHSGGLARWNGTLPSIWATEQEAELLAQSEKVWTTNKGKYHRYEMLPDRFSPLLSVTVEQYLRDSEPVRWRSWTITPIVFSAISHGDCAFVVDNGTCKIAFCGALAMAGGRINEVCSFQKALPNMMGYHGYLGGLVSWCEGVERLRAEKAEMLVPAYGPVEYEPEICLDLLEQRLRTYAQTYVEISAVRYYFPEEFKRGFELPMGITKPAVRCQPGIGLKWLTRIGETTSYLLRADSGKAILIDAGDLEAIKAVEAWLADGIITALDACWITHVHDDHLNAVWALTHQLGCRLISTAAVAEVCRNPAAWFLPALPDCIVKIDVLDDAYSWEWEEFKLTSLHFPGQCVGHAGLLVERDGQKVLLCGDSFAPTGLDDYCAENRNLTGEHRGYGRCVKLLRQYDVHQLINEHQTEPFIYDAGYLDFLEDGMARREHALAELLPDDIGFGVDRQWLRAWPMEQVITKGSVLRVSAQITGHGKHTIAIRPLLPWNLSADLTTSVHCSGQTSGSVEVSSVLIEADQWVHFDIKLPPDLHGTFLIPYDCWLDKQYLGSFTHCMVQIV